MAVRRSCFILLEVLFDTKIFELLFRRADLDLFAEDRERSYCEKEVIPFLCHRIADMLTMRLGLLQGVR